jgi:hypothetical protein
VDIQQITSLEKSGVPKNPSLFGSLTKTKYGSPFSLWWFSTTAPYIRGRKAMCYEAQLTKLNCKWIRFLAAAQRRAASIHELPRRGLLGNSRPCR